MLGALLRAARESIELRTTDVTKVLGWYPGKLSKIEQGDVPMVTVRPADVEPMAQDRAKPNWTTCPSR